MRAPLRAAVLSLLVLTLATGVIYPAGVTLLAQLLWPGPANGSLVVRAGRTVGSSLIGQAFSDPRYFWGRPSATAPVPYNGAASAGSNLGPLNPVLVDSIVAPRIARLRAADPGDDAPVPVDLVTASGSGLDPHITPAAAYYQARRVARARGGDAAAVRALIARHVEPRQLGVLGEPRVNVLLLNLALDSASSRAPFRAVRTSTRTVSEGEGHGGTPLPR